VANRRPIKLALLPIEAAILGVLLERELANLPGLHGYGLAEELARQSDRHNLAGYGTIYRALSRLEDAKYVTGRWQDAAPDPSARGGLPRRRLYRTTVTGARAIATSHQGTSLAARAAATS
jgi:DNA-binding PadR family transcriptional regulator